MGRREVDSEKAVVMGLEVVTGAAEEGGVDWTRLWRWGSKLRCRRIPCCSMRRSME